MRKAERAKAWKAGRRRSESGREGCAAAPGPGARPPTCKRTCHQVTVNASGGQSNDKSNPLYTPCIGDGDMHEEAPRRMHSDQ